MGNSIKPDFVGDNWCMVSQGYSYLWEPSFELTDDIYLTHKNPWLQLLCIFERAKQGDFTRLDLLPVLIKSSDDFCLIMSGIRILGAASNDPLLLSLIHFYNHNDMDIRIAAYGSSGASGRLDLIDPMLLAMRSRKGIERDSIADVISMLLEVEPDELIEPRSEEYENEVQEKIINIRKSITEPSIMMFGKPVDMNGVIDNIFKYVTYDDYQDYTGLVSEYLMILESYTGISIFGLVDEDLNLNKDETLYFLKRIKDKHIVDKFIIGTKYFYGHPVN